MKKKIFRSVAIFLMFCLVVTSAIIAEGGVRTVDAATFPRIGWTDSYISRRTGPGASYISLQALTPGTLVTVVGQAANGWWRVSNGGYVNHAHIIFDTVLFHRIACPM